MATIKRMTSGIRTLDSGLFSSHSGVVVIEEHAAEGGSVVVWDIYAASPTSSHFNAAPVGSKLYDTDAWATELRHTDATTWATPA